MQWEHIYHFDPKKENFIATPIINKDLVDIHILQFDLESRKSAVFDQIVLICNLTMYCRYNNKEASGMT